LKKKKKRKTDPKIVVRGRRFAKGCSIVKSMKKTSFRDQRVAQSREREGKNR